LKNTQILRKNIFSDRTKICAEMNYVFIYYIVISL